MPTSESFLMIDSPSVTETLTAFITRIVPRYAVDATENQPVRIGFYFNDTLIKLTLYTWLAPANSVCFVEQDVKQEDVSHVTYYVQGIIDALFNS